MLTTSRTKAEGFSESISAAVENQTHVASSSYCHCAGIPTWYLTNSFPFRRTGSE